MEAPLKQLSPHKRLSLSDMQTNLAAGDPSGKLNRQRAAAHQNCPGTAGIHRTYICWSA